MSRPDRTALLLPVPAADPLLSRVAEGHPATVRAGLPAHLTVLYPFVPAAQLGPATLNACARIAERAVPIAVRFTACRVRGNLVYIAPEPVEPVDALVGAVRQRWPELVPYGGRFPDAPAHVTLALDAPPADHADILRRVDPLLPVADTLDELVLVVSGPDGWVARSRWPLGRTA
ncbi:2'-5' RNA ligase family protein [Pseudonocardia acaciae]|uniref:2'-5' RNA ligase family protein n=1 Tax=Pseudonocardia acaciae TaxID=551276 RepID=UPI0014701BDD|nr:2'-5' RNA ligase family protein [Pseudonocardia acaciae]